MTSQKKIKISVLLEQIQAILKPSDVMDAIASVNKNQYKCYRQEIVNIFDCGEIFDVYKGAVDDGIEFGDLYDCAFSIMLILYPKEKLPPAKYRALSLDVAARKRFRDILIEALDNHTNDKNYLGTMPSPHYEAFLKENGGRVKLSFILEELVAEIDAENSEHPFEPGQIISKKEMKAQIQRINALFEVGELPLSLEKRLAEQNKYDLLVNALEESLSYKAYDSNYGNRNNTPDYQRIMVDREEREAFRDDFFERFLRLSAKNGWVVEKIMSRKPVFFTVQQHHSAYFSSDYGVMRSTQPIANYSEVGLTPIMVCELRSGYGVGPESTYRYQRQFFLSTQTIDFIKWIDDNVNRKDIGFFQSVGLMVDPNLIPFLGDDFVDAVNRLDRIFPVSGDANDKSHSGFYRQCQAAIETPFSGPDVQVFPKEPVGLSINAINKNYGFGDVQMVSIQECEEPQININHEALFSKAKKAVTIDVKSGFSWKPAMNFDGYVEYGCIAIEEDDPMHPRNNTTSDYPERPFDFRIIRSLLLLIPNIDSLSEAIFETDPSLPKSIKKELKQLKSGAKQSIYEDLRKALDTFYNRRKSVDSVFHVTSRVSRATVQRVREGVALFSTLAAIRVYRSDQGDVDLHQHVMHSPDMDYPDALIICANGKYYAFVGDGSEKASEAMYYLSRSCFFGVGYKAELVDDELLEELKENKDGFMSESLVAIFSKIQCDMLCQGN